MGAKKLNDVSLLAEAICSVDVLIIRYMWGRVKGKEKEPPWGMTLSLSCISIIVAQEGV